MRFLRFPPYLCLLRLLFVAFVGPTEATNVCASESPQLDVQNIMSFTKRAQEQQLLGDHTLLFMNSRYRNLALQVAAEDVLIKMLGPKSPFEPDRLPAFDDNGSIHHPDIANWNEEAKQIWVHLKDLDIAQARHLYVQMSTQSNSQLRQLKQAIFSALTTSDFTDYSFRDELHPLTLQILLEFYIVFSTGLIKLPELMAEVANEKSSFWSATAVYHIPLNSNARRGKAYLTVSRPMGRVLLNVLHILKLQRPTECGGKAYRAIWSLDVQSIYWTEATGTFNGYFPIENYLCDYESGQVLKVTGGGYKMASVQAFFTILLGNVDSLTKQTAPKQTAIREGKGILNSDYRLKN